MAFVKPVAWAKSVGVKPQIVYNWIKSKKVLFEQREDGFYIDEDAAVEVLKRGVSPKAFVQPGEVKERRLQERKERKQKLVRAPRTIEEGTIVAWPRYPKGGVTFAKVVSKTGSYTSILTTTGLEVPFTHESLRDHIRKGEILILEPRVVLEFLRDAAQTEEQREILEIAIEKFSASEYNNSGGGSDALDTAEEEGGEASS